MLLSDFVGRLVGLHSFRYDPIPVHALYGARSGAVTASLIVLSGADYGSDYNGVLIANRRPVVMIRRRLEAGNDSPIFGWVRRSKHGAIFLEPAAAATEEAIRGAVDIRPAVP